MVYTIYINFLPEGDYSDYVKTWQMKGITKSIRMVVRVYLINNGFFVRNELLILCGKVAPERTYKIYQSFSKGLLNR